LENFLILKFNLMSVNKVILIGNVGKDPDVRYLENNVRVANFPLATTERGYTMSNGTQVPDRTEWHTIVVWRGLADVAEKYVRKGARVYIEGKIKSRTYEDKMGNRRYITEIYAEDMQVLTRPQNQDGQQPTQNQQQYGVNQFTAPAAQTFTQPTAPAQQPVQQPVADPVAQPFIGAPSGMDEDLPF
jgi:single-strand DNA-binding protein